MDIASTIFNALQPLLWVIPVLILIYIIKTPWFKGCAGERIVHFCLKRLPKSDYKVLKDVTLPCESGSTQIDHIVVSKYGIFVVETKNMKGWIFGGTYQPMWQQTFFKRSSVFKNPLHQNYKHIKTLQSLLGIDDTAFHSVIVFVGEGVFKTEMPENVTKSVRSMMKYIRSFNTVIFNEQQLQTFITDIEQSRFKPGFATDFAHVQSLKKADK
ncbi:nuclease-related domain-containing protein [Photobacterium leiognathi]|uniref:nuclease-related domain-containing protein n=1 Tax=Photobacterium leiognathi TaxID=553611 RepID=UPI0027323D78|nr:nuclease-related domain-containing protein [Photobacterium leiognathi]